MRNTMMLALALGLSFNVVADEMSSTDNSGFYVGGFYSGQSASMDGSRDFKFGTLNVDFGYRINEYLAVAVRQGVGVKGESEKWYEPQYYLDMKLDWDIESQYSLLVKGIYPVSDTASLYGFAAYSKTNVEWDIQATSTTFDVTETETNSYSDMGLGWGVGVDFKYDEDWTVFFEYQVYPKFDIEGAALDWDGANLGVTFTF